MVILFADPTVILQISLVQMLGITRVLVRIASSNEGSGETSYVRRLNRAFVACIHKVSVHADQRLAK